MPLVNLTVNQRSYAIACDEGEEEHLRELASHVDSVARGLLTSAGHAGEQRLLLMTALLIADECFEARAQIDGRTRAMDGSGGARYAADAAIADWEQTAAAVLERAAARVDDIAARLPAA